MADLKNDDGFTRIANHLISRGEGFDRAGARRRVDDRALREAAEMEFDEPNADGWANQAAAAKGGESEQEDRDEAGDDGMGQMKVGRR